MRSRSPLYVAILGALWLTASCGRDRTEPAADSPRVASPAPVVAAVPGDTTCPMAGEWRTCSIKKRLERAGLVPIERPEPAREPFLSVPGTAFSLGKYAELRVYVYPDRAARERESSKLDSLTASPRGTTVDWPAPPTLFTSNNVLAILLSQNEHLIERVELAITAGLPDS